MSGFFGLASATQGLPQNTAGALIAGLWESALLVAAVWLVLKVVPRTTAAARFAIWTAVFCVSAAMPFAEMLFAARAGVAAGDAGHLHLGLHIDPRWSYLIAGAWLVAATVRLAGLAVQGWKLRSLWKGAVPVADEALAGMGCEELLAGRKVRVCTSEDVDRPSVIGFFAPRILVPTWLFVQLSGLELRHIVLHEMEHLRRRDDWMNLLQKIGLVVFPLNPALFWVDRKLAAERELACDDGVLRRTKMPRAYASCLASIAEIRLERRMHRRVVALALGVLGVAGILRGRSELSRRIESILRRRAVVSPRFAGAVAAVLVAGVLGAGLELARSPQLVSFGPVSGGQSLAELNGRGFASGVRDRGDLSGGARVRDVSFHVPKTRSSSTLGARSQSVPQRLKPQSKGGFYGTAEAVPLGKTDYVAAGQTVPLGKTDYVLASQTMSSGKTDYVAAGRAGAYRETGLSVSDEAGSRSRRVAKTRPVGVEQWMVLTSVDADAPARVVVRMSDGRFYVAPYAAVPVRDGWLIVQL